MENKSKLDINEYKKLSETLSEKEKEVDRLRKSSRRQNKLLKVVLPIIVLVVSVVLYNKLSNHNQQLEVREKKINKLENELKLNAPKINQLNKQLKDRDIRITELVNEAVVSKAKLNQLSADIESNQPQLDQLIKDLDLKDEQIDDLTQELEMKKDEFNQMKESYYRINMMTTAREATPEILYSHDEEKANILIEVIKDALFEVYNTCLQTDPEFDLYRNCFRDLSVELHNKLLFKFGPLWIVTTGRVGFCFKVSAPSAQHEQYFYRFGDIFFELFKYRDEDINRKIDEVLEYGQLLDNSTVAENSDQEVIQMVVETDVNANNTEESQVKVEEEMKDTKVEQLVKEEKVQEVVDKVEKVKQNKAEKVVTDEVKEEKVKQVVNKVEDSAQIPKPVIDKNLDKNKNKVN